MPVTVDHVESLAAALYSMGADCDVNRVWERESNEGMRDLFRDWARCAIQYCADNSVIFAGGRGVPGCP